MGRRSRSRNPAPRREKPAPGPVARPPRRWEGGLDRLPPVRRTLAIYLACAMVLSVATVIGIAALGGTLGPFIVLAYALLGGGLAFRWSQQRLTGATLSDEDRVMQTTAGGLLVISVGLAAVSALVLSLV